MLFPAIKPVSAKKGILALVSRYTNGGHISHTNPYIQDQKWVMVHAVERHIFGLNIVRSFVEARELQFRLILRGAVPGAIHDHKSMKLKYQFVSTAYYQNVTIPSDLHKTFWKVSSMLHLTAMPGLLQDTYIPKDS